MAYEKEQSEIENYLKDLAAFEKECEEAMYTDSQQAWGFIDEAKELLIEILPILKDEGQY